MCVRGSVLACTRGATAPVHDFCFIDFETCVVGSRQAWGRTDRAIHIDDDSAPATDDVMVVVADTVFVQSRGANGLNAANETFLREHSESVVYRLTRYRSDFGPGHLDNPICRDVGSRGNGP